MKTNTEDEPKRLLDNESSSYKKMNRKAIIGMGAYCSHKNIDNKNYDEKSYTTANPDQWFEARGFVSGLKNGTLGWYEKRMGKMQPQMIR